MSDRHLRTVTMQVTPEEVKWLEDRREKELYDRGYNRGLHDAMSLVGCQSSGPERDQTLREIKSLERK